MRDFCSTRILSFAVGHLMWGGRCDMELSTKTPCSTHAPSSNVSDSAERWTNVTHNKQ